jgi:hypothetical protein
MKEEKYINLKITLEDVLEVTPNFEDREEIATYALEHLANSENWVFSLDIWCNIENAVEEAKNNYIYNKENK